MEMTRCAAKIALFAAALALAGCDTGGVPPQPMLFGGESAPAYDTGAYQHSASQLGFDIGYGAYSQASNNGARQVEATDEVLAKVAHNACAKAMAKYKPKSGSLAECEEAWIKGYRAAVSASGVTTHPG